MTDAKKPLPISTTPSLQELLLPTNDKPQTSNSPPRFQCPCEQYTAVSKIWDVIISDDDSKVQSLLEWLDGETDEKALKENRLLSCGKRSRCRFRYGTSFAILNAIRDACQPHLQLPPSSAHKTPNVRTLGVRAINEQPNQTAQASPSKRQTQLKPVNYDEAFPSLGLDSSPQSLSSSFTAISSQKDHPAASNILIPRNKTEQRQPLWGNMDKTTKSTTEPTTTTGFPELSKKTDFHVTNKLVGRKKNKRRVQPENAGTSSLQTMTRTNSAWGKTSSTATATVPRSSCAWKETNATSTSMQKAVAPTTSGRIADFVAPCSVAKTDSTNLPNLSTLVTTGLNLSNNIREETSPEVGVTKLGSIAPTTPPRRLAPGKSIENDIELSHQTPPKQTFEDVYRKVITHPQVNRNSHYLNNLVSIYAALFRNMLVPSTPMELHFLFRLLVVVDQEASFEHDANGSLTATKTFCTDGEIPSLSLFQPVFATRQGCYNFARLALTKLEPILCNLPIQLLRPMVRCAALQMHCPEIQKRLHKVLEDYGERNAGLLSEFPPESVTGTHAILTLPFEKERDSRHNYRTQAEIAVYKNREETRDAFLQELRSFMNIKGKVLGAREIEKAQKRVRNESRVILDKLMSVNMMWFAQFYCELLLQVGLAPVQETDQELLNITNEEKLQKLHKRFSSRSSHTGKSSKKISIHHRAKTCSISPMDEARPLFPGYQEFFFLFLHHLPFNFGFHLRSRMTETILDRLAKLSESGLERQIVELQLMARFLGFIVFSPNWHDTTIDSSKIQALASTDGIQQLESLGLALNTRLENAWRTGGLIAAIPWITEVLRMAKWDSLSQASRSFRQLLGNLRKIQATRASDRGPGLPHRFSPSMDIVYCFLERFFHDTIGLPRLTSLPLATLAQSTNVPPDCWDRVCIGYTSFIVFAASPHMEDLATLVERIGYVQTGKSPVKARKLRPSIVSHQLSLEPSQLFGEVQSDTIANSTTPRTSLIMQNPVGQRDIKARLVEAFFHQHRAVKTICEFAVSTVLKEGAANEIILQSVQKVFEDSNVGNESSESEFATAEAVSLEMAKHQLQKKLEDTILASLKLYGSPQHNRVLKVAVSLSVTRGLASAESFLQSSVSGSIGAMRSTMQREKKQTGVNNRTSKLEHGIQHTIRSLDTLTTDLASPWNASEMANLIDRVRKVSENVFHVCTSMQTMIPSELHLRLLFDAIVRLDCSSTESCRRCVAVGTTKESFHMLSGLLDLVIKIRSVCSTGMKEFIATVDSSILLHLIESSMYVNGSDQFVLTIFQGLFDAKITSLAVLESLNLKDLNKHSLALISRVRSEFAD